MSTGIDHDEISRIMQAHEHPGVGIHPNPFSEKQPEWERRRKFAKQRKMLTDKIEALFEPRFITTPEISECIESLVTMTNARKILEVGTYSGFTSLHVLRAIIGKPGAQLTCIDARPAHDAEFFKLFPEFEFIQGWTPGALSQLHGRDYDMVFVDSDHSLDHTQKEIEALKAITHLGTLFIFHDMPQFASPENRTVPEVRKYVEAMNRRGELTGVCLPSCQQEDCRLMWGDGYPQECNPGLGVFIRT